MLFHLLRVPSRLEQLLPVLEPMILNATASTGLGQLLMKTNHLFEILSEDLGTLVGMSTITNQPYFDVIHSKRQRS